MIKFIATVVAGRLRIIFGATTWSVWDRTVAITNFVFCLKWFVNGSVKVTSLKFLFKMTTSVNTYAEDVMSWNLMVLCSTMLVRLNGESQCNLFTVCSCTDRWWTRYLISIWSRNNLMEPWSIINTKPIILSSSSNHIIHTLEAWSSICSSITISMMMVRCCIIFKIIKIGWNAGQVST